MKMQLSSTDDYFVPLISCHLKRVGIPTFPVPNDSNESPHAESMYLIINLMIESKRATPMNCLQDVQSSSQARAPFLINIRLDFFFRICDGRRDVKSIPKILSFLSSVFSHKCRFSKENREIPSGSNKLTKLRMH